MGDGAEMVMMELVDYNEAMLKDTTAKKAKSTRRGGKKKATETVEAPAQVAETATEEPKAE
jgi:large subunit ribosomal protein L17